MLEGADRLKLGIVDYRQRIVVNPEIRGGKPLIRGTRITVGDVFEYLGGGMSVDEVLSDFPSLKLEDIQACFAFAAERERCVTSIAA